MQSCPSGAVLASDMAAAAANHSLPRRCPPSRPQVPAIIPDGSRPDYLATVDIDPASPTYSQARHAPAGGPGLLAPAGRPITTSAARRSYLISAAQVIHRLPVAYKEDELHHSGGSSGQKGSRVKFRMLCCWGPGWAAACIIRGSVHDYVELSTALDGMAHFPLPSHCLTPAPISLCPVQAGTPAPRECGLRPAGQGVVCWPKEQAHCRGALLEEAARSVHPFGKRALGQAGAGCRAHVSQLWQTPAGPALQPIQYLPARPPARPPTCSPAAATWTPPRSAPTWCCPRCAAAACMVRSQGP